MQFSEGTSEGISDGKLFELVLAADEEALAEGLSPALFREIEQAGPNGSADILQRLTH
jgi:hypothetical protein